jgi:high-affinity K+ transport system ATPase subunit B
MYEIVEKFVEEALEEPIEHIYSNSFQPQKQSNEPIRLVVEVRTIYEKVLTKLNHLISQLNKKSFYYTIDYWKISTTKLYRQKNAMTKVKF